MAIRAKILAQKSMSCDRNDGLAALSTPYHMRDAPMFAASCPVLGSSRSRCLSIARTDASAILRRGEKGRTDSFRSFRTVVSGTSDRRLNLLTGTSQFFGECDTPRRHSLRTTAHRDSGRRNRPAVQLRQVFFVPVTDRTWRSWQWPFMCLKLFPTILTDITTCSRDSS
jgi:hypothetical protein